LTLVVGLYIFVNNMAQGTAIAIAVGIVINRPRRQPNNFRQVYVSNEVDYVAIRLNRPEEHQIALEYVRWQL